ncbi:MAG TPA: hypothetical protein VFF73_01170 [Planctomycetota bacterium]|nr:hypothetical protein [Planctomycetota bacterium]
MSFVHFLTIGRFGFGDTPPPSALMDRVVFPVIPEELKPYLARSTPTFLVPFSEDELVQLEREVRRRFDVEVSLRDFLTKDRLLRIQYTDWVRVLVAEHVAVVARELFGAVAADRDQFVDPDRLERRSQECAIQNAERKRIFAIKDGGERMAAVIQALERAEDDPKKVHVWIAVEMVSDVAAGHVSELIRALRAAHRAVQAFAGYTLQRLGPAASEAIPALVDVLCDTKSAAPGVVVDALGAMGPKGEAGLVIALDHSDSLVRWRAIRALGNLGQAAEPTRARLRQIAAGTGEHADAARKALFNLGP